MRSDPPPIWPQYRIVIFDCDSTLSSIEGIDELARISDKGDDVALNIAALTKRAMEGDIPLESVYGQRLLTVNPTQSQVLHIAKLYRDTVVPDARATINALQTLGVKVYVISAGLIDAVRDFAIWLGVPREQIYAVSMEYDQLSGMWWRYWEQSGDINPRANYLSLEASPLTGSYGKNRVINHIQREHPGRILMVGDGLSDLETKRDVGLFVGFGGAVFRDRVFQEAEIYLHKFSLASILALALGTRARVPGFASIWAEGLRQIHAREVTFKHEKMKKVFMRAIRRVREDENDRAL